MGQKSLASLHRIDSSMTWNSIMNNKKNKWSYYNVWFIYTYFYKIIFFFTLYNEKNKFNIIKKEGESLIKKLKKFIPETYTPRFSYYIDLHCIEFFNYMILLNLYFFTNLIFFKKKNEISFEKDDIINILNELNNINDYPKYSHKSLNSNFFD